MKARKGFLILAFAAIAAAAPAGGGVKETDSLFLSSDAFMAPKSQTARVSRLEINDESDDTTTQYSLGPQKSDWDARELALTPRNCAAVLVIIAICGGLALIRDRYFSAYR